MTIKQYPIAEALNMLFEELVPNFSWFFNQEKIEATKFRKAVTTELGRRAATHPEKSFTTSLVSAVYGDKIAYFVVINPKSDGESEDESSS